MNCGINMIFNLYIVMCDPKVIADLNQESMCQLADESSHIFFKRYYIFEIRALYIYKYYPKIKNNCRNSKHIYHKSTLLIICVHECNKVPLLRFQSRRYSSFSEVGSKISFLRFLTSLIEETLLFCIHCIKNKKL